MQLQRAASSTSCSKVTSRRFSCSVGRLTRTAASQQQQQQSSSADAAASSSAEPVAPVTREFTALGSKVVESNTAFKGPEDEQDFWEGEKFDAFGKALENYFVPGLIALGLVCGGIAAKTYNDGATEFLKPAPGPDAEASIIIAIPEASAAAPSPSS